MLATLWSTKGGSGTSVVATALTNRLGSADKPAVMVDLDGSASDLCAVDLGGPGITDWLSSEDDPPADVIERLGVEVNESVRVVPRGAGSLKRGDRAQLLAQLIAMCEHDVVVDCGTIRGGGGQVARALYESASHAVLVVRPCYLALRRAQASRWTPTEIVVVREPGRVLGRRDIEQVVGVPVSVEIPFDASVSRAVDAGLLVSRPPRLLERALRKVAR